ncbi:MAG: hypothetical protein HY659_01340 [Rhizobiales bacterium]|nr:hypothetical protein [Hyphomicrobiales bacterium]
MMQPLARTLDDAAPALIVTIDLERRPVVLLAYVEAEAGIKSLRRVEVGNCKRELVERMNTELSVIAGRRDLAPDCGHYRMLLHWFPEELPWKPSELGACDTILKKSCACCRVMAFYLAQICRTAGDAAIRNMDFGLI